MRFRSVSILLISAILPFCSARAQVSNGLPAARVYAIQPSCFELMFTSTMDNRGGKPILTFNHINGRTFFAGAGEAVLDYVVKSFDPADEMVFNPSVNSYVEKKAGLVTLQSVEGSKFLLELGKILPQPGWIACIVWLDSGNWMYAGDNDAIPAAGGVVPVHAITRESVSVMRGDEPQSVPLISDNEKKLLVTLWENRRKESEQSALAASKPREEQAPRVVTQFVRTPPDIEPVLNPSRRLVEIRTPPQFFFGTEYRYPVSFETVPLIVRTASGTTIRQAMVVPKRFQTGWMGNGVRIGNGGNQITITQ